MGMAWLYDLSFTFFILITACALLATTISLIVPALFSTSSSSSTRNGGGGANVNWNVIAIVGSYVAIAIISLVIYLSRRITTLQKLRSIPKKVVANKEGDVPSAVAHLIAVEYDRACAVVHISQPPIIQQEGWGAPGTEHEGIQFRRAMLDGLSSLDALARSLIPTFPPMKPHQSAEAHLKPLESILTRYDPQCLIKYSALIQKARYAEKEPTVEEYEVCMGLQGQMKGLLRLLQSKEDGH